MAVAHVVLKQDVVVVREATPIGVRRMAVENGVMN
jgi:hypothetical protein